MDKNSLSPNDISCINSILKDCIHGWLIRTILCSTKYPILIETALEILKKEKPKAVKNDLISMIKTINHNLNQYGIHLHRSHPEKIIWFESHDVQLNLGLEFT